MAAHPSLLGQAFQYVSQNQARFIEALSVHARLSLSALAVAAALAIPLGVVCARWARLARVATGLFSLLRVIPSLALLAVMIPWLGTGFAPSLAALVILAAPSILLNTSLGFRRIDPGVIEVARGLGMDRGQIFRRVEWPLAQPAILAGLRTAAVEVIAGATLAAFIGGGGLGVFIVSGLAMYDFRLLVVGALPVATFALVAEAAFAWINRFVTEYERC